MIDISLNQDYLNSVTEMLNNYTIPAGNSDIMHRLILRKTRTGYKGLKISWPSAASSLLR